MTNLLLERLSDMGRLLVDLQREEALTRKTLILPNLNAAAKEIFCDIMNYL